MLKAKTEEMVNELKDFMQEAIKQTCDVDVLLDMNETEFGMLQKGMKLMNSSIDLVVAQAELLDEQNEKLDMLLKQNEKLLKLIEK